MIELVGTFIIVWIVGTFLHELGHALSATIQDGYPKIKIWLWKGFIPSWKCIYDGELKDRRMFLFSGGITVTILYYIIYQVVPDTLL